MAHDIPPIPGCTRCLYYTAARRNTSWVVTCGHPHKRALVVCVADGSVTRCTGYKPTYLQLSDGETLDGPQSK